MKLLRFVKVRSFGPSVSADELVIAVNTWLASIDPGDVVTNEEFVDIEFHTDGSSFWCFVTYVDA